MDVRDSTGGQNVLSSEVILGFETDWELKEDFKWDDALLKDATDM